MKNSTCLLFYVPPDLELQPGRVNAACRRIHRMLKHGHCCIDDDDEMQVQGEGSKMEEVNSELPNYLNLAFFWALHEFYSLQCPGGRNAAGVVMFFWAFVSDTGAGKGWSRRRESSWVFGHHAEFVASLACQLALTFVDTHTSSIVIRNSHNNHLNHHNNHDNLRSRFGSRRLSPSVTFFLVLPVRWTSAGGHLWRVEPLGGGGSAGCARGGDTSPGHVPTPSSPTGTEHGQGRGRGGGTRRSTRRSSG